MEPIEYAQMRHPETKPGGVWFVVSVIALSCAGLALATLAGSIVCAVLPNRHHAAEALAPAAAIEFLCAIPLAILSCKRIMGQIALGILVTTLIGFLAILVVRI